LAVTVVSSVDGAPPEDDQTDSEYVELVEKLFDSVAFLMYTPKVVNVVGSEGAVNDWANHVEPAAVRQGPSAPAAKSSSVRVAADAGRKARPENRNSVTSSHANMILVRRRVPESRPEENLDTRSG
jgi:hypothetical protein